MTLTMKVELPDSYRFGADLQIRENFDSSLSAYSNEVKSLIDGLLQRDVDKRLGCCGQGAEEVRSWLHKLLAKLTIRLVLG